MQPYVGMKQVKARPMLLGEFEKNYDRKVQGTDLDGDAPGYVVRYPDGYVSWCPAGEFEKYNRPLQGMTFGMALEAAKQGAKIARIGWNGKGMFLTIIKAGNAMHMGFPMQDCLAMKTADHKMQPGWLASQTDMLAEDWTIVG